MSNTTVGSHSSAITDLFEFTLNGETVTVAGVASTLTLLEWLRRSGRTGSKGGCAEGDCGACTVAIVDRRADGSATYRAINSCLAFMPMLAGREVVTVEGLAQGAKLHPVQSAFVEHYGSQCGYCTPGFVNAATVLIERLKRAPVPRGEVEATVAAALEKHICRCTGYVRYYQAVRDVILATPGLTRDGA